MQLLDLLPSKYRVPTTAIFIKDQDGKACVLAIALRRINKISQTIN